MKHLKLLSATSMFVATLLFSNGAAAQRPPAHVPPQISTCCPPLATYPVTTMFNSVQANVGGPYHLNFTMAAAFNAQMAAYVALLKALDPSVVAMAVVVNAYHGGPGATAVIGPLLQTGVAYWTPPPPLGGNSGLLPPTFFTSVADRPANTWTVVQMTTWVFRQGGWRQLCETRSFAFRPQLVGARMRSGSAGGFVDYRGPAPRARPAPPPAIPELR